MSKQSKKVTLESLAATMETGFKRMDKGFKDAKEDNESLARMVANGFEHTATKEDIARLEKGQATLEQGQENIQLRVDSLAPYFEVKHLERRVKRLEDRAGIRHSIQH
jgi:hypothetical protein